MVIFFFPKGKPMSSPITVVFVPMWIRINRVIMRKTRSNRYSTCHAMVPRLETLKKIYQMSTSGKCSLVALKTRMEIEMERKIESGWGWRRAVEGDGAGEKEETEMCTFHLYKFMVSNITSFPWAHIFQSHPLEFGQNISISAIVADTVWCSRQHSNINHWCIN